MDTLMSLVGEYGEIMAMINDPEIDQQTVLDTLEGIEGAIEVKADGYGHVLRGIGFERSALAGKKAYLQKLMDAIDKQDARLESQEEAMKDRLMATLIALDKDEEGIKTDEFTFKVVSRGGVQKLEKTGEVPESFKEVITTYKDDDKKIREYVKDHPDCKWARLLPRKRVLDVKGV